MIMSEMTAKDIIVGVGFILLCFFAGDYFLDISKETDNIKSDSNAIKDGFQKDMTELTRSNTKTLLAIKDMQISVARIESDVSNIKDNNKNNFETLSEKINNISKELKDTRESLNNSLQETNKNVYSLQQEIGQLDGRVKIVEYKMQNK